MHLPFRVVFIARAHFRTSLAKLIRRTCGLGTFGPQPTLLAGTAPTNVRTNGIVHTRARLGAIDSVFAQRTLFLTLMEINLYKATFRSDSVYLISYVTSGTSTFASNVVAGSGIIAVANIGTIFAVSSLGTRIGAHFTLEILY